MKTSELRIGNLVNVKYNDGTISEVEVLNIDKDSINTTHHYGEIDSYINDSFLLGIELTDEWLIKFGFKPNGYGGFVKSWHPSKYNDYLIEYRVGRGMNEIGYSIWDASTNGHPEIKNSIQYVHELQNIWYWQTRNEELKTEEPINQ